MRDFHQKSVNVHDFAMTPDRNVPRSSFRFNHVHKTTIDSGYLIPFYWDLLLPGDTFNLGCSCFCRMATPLVPVMDNLYFDVQYFAVPIRLLWSNFVKFMGEQDNPADSISYVIPQTVCPAGGYTHNTIFDYLGLPTIGQVGGGATVSHSNLPLRAYNLIFKHWYRDENLQNSPTINMGNGPDTYTDFALLRRGKRKDYFTSALPWAQKGAAVSFPLGTSAPVKGIGVTVGAANAATVADIIDGAGATIATGARGWATSGNTFLLDTLNSAGNAGGTHFPGIYADLSAATASTINALRLAEFTQQFLELDARGGTRYPELVYSHFKVRSPDARMQIPEFLGSSSSPIVVNAIPQTSATGLTGGTTPAGNLAAIGTGWSKSGYTYSATEHCVVLGICSVRAELTYQQGLRRQWSYSTRYDFPWPVFATLGEQSILNKEIYCDGSANDALAFGYQERYGEARYFPSLVTGYFKSTDATPLDMWHFGQKFTALPTLNTTFIQETPPVQRALAVAAQTGKEFLLDAFFDTRAARPLPMFGVPSLANRF